MRIIQRKHRQSLRRRVANGEVDLEALGIKRLNVPQEVLDKMPLHTYTTDDPSLNHQQTGPFSATVSSGPPSPNQTAANDHNTISGVMFGTNSGHSPAGQNQQGYTVPSPQSITSSSTASCPRHVQFAQHTCPICLDDFESNVTSVRELPCGHIFHPECVDMFLKESSSLCPMCKKSVLPLGFCPDKVTNAMVRRERLVRRMRERVTLEVVEEPEVQRWLTQGRSLSVAAGARMASFHRQFGSASQRRISSAPTPGSVEMVSNPQALSADPQTPSRADTTLRREWGRNRLVQSLDNRRTVEDEDNAREAALPKCEHVLVKGTG